MNLKSKKWVIPLLVLLIFISVAIFIQFSLGFGYFRNTQIGIFLNSFSKNPFTKQSSVNISNSGDKLNIKFNLTPEDRPIFNSFVNNWFGTNKSINTIDLEIDQNTLNFLEPIMPVDLDLTIAEKSIEFKNQSAPLLQNALIKNDFEFASGSGKINVIYTDNSKYQMNIENPADLVDYATSSGTLTISNKLDSLFKSLPQVATIELNVNGKNISGKIMLK